MNIPFKEKYNYQERLEESTRILNKYPDRIPIICEKSVLSKNDPIIDKNKYLVPKDLTIGQFIFVIRHRLKITHEKALFLFFNGCSLPSTYFISDIYYDYRDNDGFLYSSYSFENVFGNCYLT